MFPPTAIPVFDPYGFLFAILLVLVVSLASFYFFPSDKR